MAEATDSPSAYEAYLLGRDLLEQRSPEGTRNAIIQFERAVALDSSYAEAYVGLADSYVLGGSFDWFPDYRASIDTGLAAARRALDLDPDLSSAYTSIGFAHWNYGNWDEAEEAFQDAIRLRPQYALAHQWHALLLLTTGRAEEAVIEAQQARDLDPLYRQAYRNLAWALEAAGRIEDAIDTSQEMINLSPTWQVGWDHHARLLLESGEYEGGLEAALEAAGLLGLDLDDARGAYEAVIRYRRTGEPQPMPPPPDWPRFYFVWMYANTGQPDRAIDAFEEDLARAGGSGPPRSTTS